MDKVLVIGGTNIDFICKSKNPLIPADSNTGENFMSFGGVGRNICENLGRLGVDVSFISAVGDDAFATAILAQLSTLKVNTEHVAESGIRTGSYISVLDDHNDMYIAVCDNEAINDLDVSYFEQLLDYINSFKYVVLDSNLSSDVLNFLLTNVQGKVFIDATSSAKAVKLRPYLSKISFLKCNYQEANALFETQNASVQDLLMRFLDSGIEQVVITSGTKPIFYNKQRTVFTADIIKLPQEKIKSTTGCGDAFMSGMIYGMLKSMTIHACVSTAKRCSAQTLEVIQACNPNLNVNKSSL